MYIKQHQGECRVSKQYVSEIKDRDPVNAVFLVKDKILAMAKNGKPYMNLRLMDKSGDIEARCRRSRLCWPIFSPSRRALLPKCGRN
jgi:hypothetical protein